MTTLSDTTTAKRISVSTLPERVSLTALMVVLVLTNILFFAVALPYAH